MKKFILSSIASALALGACSGNRSGEPKPYPSKSIEFVIHAGVGGGTDRNARALATPLTEALNADIAFASKKGGAGAVAMKYINSRPADGYTLTVLTTGHATAIARGRSAMGVDDFIYLGQGTSEPQVFFAKCDRFASAKDFIAYQKQTALSYGITNVGGIDDIAALWFARVGDLQAPRAVPFKSGGEIVTNVIAGNVDVAVLNPAEALTQVESGEICPVVVLAPSRFPSYRETPTAKEMGIDVSFSVLRGFAIKAGAPEEVVEKLKASIAVAVDSEYYRDFLQQNDLDFNSSVGTSEEFESEFRSLVDEMARAMKGLGYIQ